MDVDQLWLPRLVHDSMPPSHPPHLVGEMVSQELDLAVMFADCDEEQPALARAVAVVPSPIHC